MLKRVSTFSTSTPSQIFAEVINQVPEQALTSFANEETTKRMLRRQKNKGNPKKPSCLSELTINNEWAMYKDERFLLFDNGPGSNERIIIFSLDEGLVHLSEADTWFCDGNFKLCPEFFLQLYVIRVKKYDKFITPIFCLLQKKTRSTYEEMFTAIFNKCSENNVYPDPKIMNMDFEQAVIQAAKTVIGEHLIIQGCFYHLCQSTHRKLQELGLQNKYNHDNVFSHYCSMIDGLAFLPVQKVIEGMKYLKSICAPDNTDIIDYFDSTYVTGTYRKVGVSKFRRNKPLYPPETWNVHEATLHSRHRTNNICESWNNRFAHLIGHSHPTIWKLINKFREEVGVDKAKIALHDMEPVRKKKHGTEKNVKLQYLCRNIVNNELTIAEFLNRIGHCLRKRNVF